MKTAGKLPIGYMCSNFEMELVPLTEVSDHAGYSAMSALTMVQGAISSLQTICQVVAVVALSALYQLRTLGLPTRLSILGGRHHTSNTLDSSPRWSQPRWRAWPCSCQYNRKTMADISL